MWLRLFLPKLSNIFFSTKILRRRQMWSLCVNIMLSGAKSLASGHHINIEVFVLEPIVITFCWPYSRVITIYCLYSVLWDSFWIIKNKPPLLMSRKSQTYLPSFLSSWWHISFLSWSEFYVENSIRRLNRKFKLIFC